MAITKAQQDAEAELSPKLRQAFNALVSDYREAVQRHTGQGGVNYHVLSELVRAGWRKAEPPSR